MVKIRYFADPFKPRGENHSGLISTLIDVDFMEFQDDITAYEFWKQCTEPITKIKEIFPQGRIPRGIRKPKEEIYLEEIDEVDNTKNVIN